MHQVRNLSRAEIEVVVNDERCHEVVKSLTNEEVIGLDTETFWVQSDRSSSVSLVQIASSQPVVFVIDAQAVNLDHVRPVVESNRIKKVAHNARFDAGMLEGEGLKPSGFVDTLRLARIALSLPSYSLASVTHHLFGVELDKSYQRSNWRRRPLSAKQIEYAALDAHITLALYRSLISILTEQNRLDLAMRAAVLGPVRRAGTNSTGARRASQVPREPLRPLTDEEKAVLLRLKKWRLERSMKMRISAYMVCSDRTLEELVINRPGSLEELELIYGLGPAKIADIGRRLLLVLEGKESE
jgi:ribonuclease D